MNSARRIALAILTAAFAAATSAIPVRADVIMDWNEKADAIAAEKRTPTPTHGRGLAMLHIAMFEAVNAVERRYSSYKLNLSADPNTSKEAAAASAGYDVLLSLYPDQKADLDATLAKILALVADGEPKTKGMALGKKAAAQVIALRADDGINTPESYRPRTIPGIYVPTAMVVSSTVGALTPWVMTSGSQFRPGPPPELNSDTWTRDLNEIRELGARNSTTRTAEQTTIGRFWFLTGARSYNPVVHQVAKVKNMDLIDCSRLFALVSMAGVDAYIAVFDAKYAYNFWRPVTAIRNADLTSNKATPRDASWLPLGDTPMHPEYPCAHCITSAAVSAVIQRVVGDHVGEITLTSPTAPGITRTWTRLQDYSDEVSSARIYAGFHYRFSIEAGKAMGKKIGELTASTQLHATTASSR